MPTINEEDEPVGASLSTAKAVRHISFCLSMCSSIRPSARGSTYDLLTDPLFDMLLAKVKVEVGEEEGSDDGDNDDDEDVDADSLSCSSFSLDSLLAKVEIHEPVGVEQDLDSPLRPAPLAIRKKMVEVPPAAHPESLRVPVTYPKGAARSLHPAMQALCDHFNA
jgi:hypothetical protein